MCVCMCNFHFIPQICFEKRQEDLTAAHKNKQLLKVGMCSSPRGKKHQQA